MSMPSAWSRCQQARTIVGVLIHDAELELENKERVKRSAGHRRQIEARLRDLHVILSALEGRLASPAPPNLHAVADGAWAEGVDEDEEVG